MKRAREEEEGEAGAPVAPVELGSAAHQKLLDEIDEVQVRACVVHRHLLLPACSAPRAHAVRPTPPGRQESLEQLEQEEAEALMEVQRAFSRKRASHFVQRAGAITRLPGFWREALQAHPVLGSMVSSAADREALAGLTEIAVLGGEDDKSGYSIIFKFSPAGAPHGRLFSDTELWKSVSSSADGCEVRASGVTWLAAEPPADSFFQWFCEEAASHLEDEVLSMLKNDLWLDPLTHYMREDDGGELGDDDEDGEEEDAEEEGDSASQGGDDDDASAGDVAAEGLEARCSAE